MERLEDLLTKTKITEPGPRKEAGLFRAQKGENYVRN